MSSLTRVVILLSLGIYGITTVAADCGKVPLAGRIMGGQNSIPGRWPWQVSIRDANQTHYCGGSLVDHKTVISAAHCFPNANVTKSPVTACLGSFNLTEANPNEVCVKVKNITNYPNYTKDTDSGDISILELDSELNMTNYIFPVCIPVSGLNFSGSQNCWVTGWGDISFATSLPSPKTLQEVSLPLIDAKKCNETYNTNAGGAAKTEIRDDMICTGYLEGGKSACQGDSGGPVVCLKDGLWYLVGVVSFAAGCGLPKRPGVNTLVPSFTNWILQNDPHAFENVRPEPTTTVATTTTTTTTTTSGASTRLIFSLLIPVSFILLVSH